MAASEELAKKGWPYRILEVRLEIYEKVKDLKRLGYSYGRSQKELRLVCTSYLCLDRLCLTVISQDRKEDEGDNGRNFK